MREIAIALASCLFGFILGVAAVWCFALFIASRADDELF